MKPHKLVSSKNLSSPSGVADVSFGAATPEQRSGRNFAKSNPNDPVPVFDDHKERQARWNSLLT